MEPFPTRKALFPPMLSPAMMSSYYKPLGQPRPHLTKRGPLSSSEFLFHRCYLTSSWMHLNTSNKLISYKFDVLSPIIKAFWLFEWKFVKSNTNSDVTIMLLILECCMKIISSSWMHLNT